LQNKHNFCPRQHFLSKFDQNPNFK